VDELDLEQRIEQLAALFLQRARIDAVSVHEMIERAVRADAVDVDVDPLEYLAHRLHGAGKTFGYLAVGNCAAEIEHLIQKFKLRVDRTETAMEPELRDHLLDCARRLTQEIEAAVAL
jgi:HPt (histidine-containing phosphotransfer) domain-containing protein